MDRIAATAGGDGAVLTEASLFSGGGLADIGAMQAGFRPIFAIEHDPAIASCYERNVPGRMIVADVRDVEPVMLETPTLLWVSPPCQQHSRARSKALPARADGDIGIEVLRFVRVLLPPAVCLENVIEYRDAPVFRLIVRGLSDLGYTVAYGIIDASDYGVPQTRRRLILRAVRGGLLVPLPAPMRPKIGWYAAIADLIPTLPASKFADWQIRRLSSLGETALVRNDNTRQEWGKGYRSYGEPSVTVSGNGKLSRVFLVDGKDGGERGLPYRDEALPAQSVVASIGNHEPRAFLAHPTADNPRFTASMADDPVFTLTTTENRPRAWLDTGGVVKLTPRALARLQSVPDWYVLPDSASLAGKVIGNGVACRVAEMVCRNVLAAIDNEETA